jgi:pSer/pThr/pTyr-binding forkhead associated (FHA) protein
MDARLNVLSGPGSGETIPVLHGKLLIGREQDCHLRLESGLVSRHHCVLMLDEYTLRVRDLGSRNGTYVNGRRINSGQTVLLHGDIVSIASINEMTFEIQLAGEPAGTQPVVPEARPSDSASALEGTGLFEGETALSGEPGVPALPHSPTPWMPIPVVPQVLSSPPQDHV